MRKTIPHRDPDRPPFVVASDEAAGSIVRAMLQAAALVWHVADARECRACPLERCTFVPGRDGVGSCVVRRMPGEPDEAPYSAGVPAY